MSYTKRIAYNTAIQILARVITTGISIAVIGVLTRYLGVEGYGQYTLIFSYLSLFGVFVDFGFFLLQVREITKYPEREAEIMGSIFGLKLALSVIVFAIGYLVATFLYDDPAVVQGILIGSISQASLALQHIPNGYFQAHLRMQIAAALNVVARVAYIGLIVWAVQGDMGIAGLVWVTTAINLVIFLGQWLIVGRDMRLTPKVDFVYWKYFVMESLPLGIVVVLSMMYFKLDLVMLSLLKDEYAVGIYGTPYRVIEVLLTFPTIFMSSVFPVLTNALNENFEKAQSIFRRAFDFTALVALPIGFGTMAIATPVMVLITNSTSFAPSGAVLSIIIWACVLSFFGAVFNYTVIAAGRQSILVWPYLVATIFNIVANIFIIPTYSYIGASYVMIATELLVISWVAWLTWKHCHLTPKLDVLFRAAAAAAVMYVLITFVLHLDSLVLNILIAGATYIGCAFLFRAVPPELIHKLIRR